MKEESETTYYYFYSVDQLKRSILFDPFYMPNLINGQEYTEMKENINGWSNFDDAVMVAIGEGYTDNIVTR